MKSIDWFVLFQRDISNPSLLEEHKFSLQIDNNNFPLFNDFKNQVKIYFKINQDFYFEHYTQLVNENNIIDVHTTDCPLLGIQLINSKQRIYTFTLQTVPETRFKINQGIRYTYQTALCEFIDNSIQYTKDCSSKRLIVISIKKSKVGVWDNGIGMDPPAMHKFAKLAERGFSEDTSQSYVLPQKKPDKLIYFDENIKTELYNNFPQLFSSFLSKWGTGAKLAMDKLGAKQTITSTKQHANVKSILTLDRDNKNWTGDIKNEPLNKNEIPHSFTDISITDVDPQLFNESWDKQENQWINILSNIYYFYTNGWVPFFIKTLEICMQHDYCKKKLGIQQNDIIMIKERYSSSFTNVSLRLNSKILLSHSSFRCIEENACSVFPFHIEFCLPPPEINTIANSDNTFLNYIAIGFIYYFPFIKSETFPENSKRVEYYWVGRLLPEEDLLPDFMDPSHYKKVQDYYINRTKALIFLNRAYLPTPEKTRLVGDNSGKEEFKKHTIYNNKISKLFSAWIQECHKAYDCEYSFIENIGSEVFSGGLILKYKKLETMDKNMIRQNDFVKLSFVRTKTKPPVYGFVSHFQYKVYDSYPARQQQKIVLKQQTFIKFKDVGFLLDDIHIQVEPDSDKLIRELKENLTPIDLRICEKKEKQQTYPKTQSISKIKSNTSNIIALNIYLFNAKNKKIPNLSSYMLDYKLESKDKEDTRLPSGKNITIKNGKKYFEFDFPAKLPPKVYNLCISVYIPQHIILGESFTINTKIIVEIECGTPKKLILQNTPKYIQLGCVFPSPIVLLQDDAGIYFNWVEFDKKYIYPKISIISPNFKFTEEYKIKYNNHELYYTNTAIEMEDNSFEIEPNELIILEYSICNIKEQISIPIIAGIMTECIIDTPKKLQNCSNIPISLYPIDNWKNNINIDSINLNFYEHNGPNSLELKKSTKFSFNYPFETDIFTHYPKDYDNTNRKVELLYPLNDEFIDKRRIYMSFTIDGYCFKVGDCFKACTGIHRIVESFGIITLIYQLEDEPNKNFIEYTFIYLPRYTDSEDSLNFKKIKWEDRELCLTDWSYPNREIRKTVLHKIYLLSEDLYKKYQPYYSSLVYFANKIYSRNISVNFVNIQEKNGNYKSNSYVFYSLGSTRIIECNLDNLRKHTLLNLSQQKLINKFYHRSSFQWIQDGKLMSDYSDILPKQGSLIMCLPKNTLIHNSSNFCFSIHIGIYETQFLVSHKRVNIIPSKNLCKIDITVIGEGITFNKSIIEGIGGSLFKLHISGQDEYNKDLSHLIEYITIEENDIILHKLQGSNPSIQLSMPDKLQIQKWKIKLHTNTWNLDRDILVKSNIGNPHSIQLINIYDEYNNEVTKTNDLYNIRCGVPFTYKFIVLDENSQKFDKDTWTKKKLTSDKFAYQFYQSHSVQSHDLEFISISKNEYPIECKNIIISSVGCIEYAFSIEINNINAQSPIIKANISAGLPVKVSALSTPIVINTHEQLKLQARLLDIAGNSIENSNVKLILYNPTWCTPSTILFNNNDSGWYTHESIVKKIGDHEILIIAKESRKSGRGLEIEPYKAKFKVEQADNIASSLHIILKHPEIKVGGKISVVTKAYDEDKSQLENLPLVTTLHYNGSIITDISQPLTQAGEYIIRVELDKDYTLFRKTLYSEKVFKVLPGSPRYIKTIPRLQSNEGILTQGKWLWENKLTIQLVDKYENICNNISGKYITIQLLIVDSQNNICPINPQEIIKGECSIHSRLFSNIQLAGAYTLYFSYNHIYNNTTDTISKTVDFSTNMADIRGLQNQGRHIENQVKTKKRERDELQRKFEFKYPYRKTNNNTNRLMNLKRQYQTLENETSQISEPLFQKSFKEIQQMKVYGKYREHFIGNIGSLGFIGNLDETTWDSHMIETFNRELTSWLGKSKMESIVIDCNDSTIREQIIIEIKNEISSNDIKIQTLVTKYRNIAIIDDSQQYIAFSNKLRDVRGCLGYACNLIFLDRDQLSKNLRRTLWYPLLHDTLVFDTSANLGHYCAHVDNSIFAFTLDGNQRRGNAINLSGKSNIIKPLGFSAPSNSSKRESLLQEIRDLETYFNKYEYEEEKIKKLDSDIIELEHKLSNIQNVLQGNIKKELPKKEKQTGLQADGFSNLKPILPQKRRSIANRGKTKAKRGRYY